MRAARKSNRKENTMTDESLVADSHQRRMRQVADYYKDTNELEAKLSCTMVQHGAHIDSLPVEPPLPPIKFSMVEKDGL
jgi:hypothetical protein